MKKDSILIVDDEPNNLEVIETMLDGENYDLYYASNGEEAIAGLDAFNPDVILLDLTMPVMDGLEVCQRLKLIRKWRAVPIIMVTASASKAVLSKCLAAGADDFIDKPVDKVEMRARIKSMLRIKKQFDRIESLTKLQQKNISLLENDLGELGCDLAVGFANELNIPLGVIMERLMEIEHNINKLERPEILNLVNAANGSAIELEKLTNKIWIYLELALEKKQFHNDETSNIKQIIQQIATIQSQNLNRDADVKIDLEHVTVAVTNQHCEWIVKETLDRALKFSHAGEPITISGRVIDRVFHLSISHPDADGIKYNGLSAQELHSLEDRELGLGLKIVKKIVDIYDGIFSVFTVVSTTVPDDTRYDTTINISLPLAI